jgi:ABC-2 type transport system ATP-binding protein
MLTGQLRPSEGSARVLGYDVVTKREILQAEIGVVFEHQNLYERLSGRDNLTFSARLYGANGTRVDDVLTQLGMVDYARKKVKTYSNGMKQRLLIARALLHQPRLLFLDEPTRGLDPNVARDIRAFVAGLAAQGVTIFLTTHYMEEADRLSDRVAILHQGKIIALDTPEALKATYAQTTEGTPTLEDVFVHLTGSPLRQRFEA